MSGAPPFVPGRIHGVRLWTVTLGCGSMALCGLNGSAWTAGGEPTRARCSPFVSRYTGRERHDHAPASNCTCGLYSMHPWPEQTAEVAGSLLAGDDLAIPVMGVVEAWGRIEVHEDGFRAEYARPHSLVLFTDSFPDDYAEILAVLASTYEVGVVRVQEAGSLVLYCAENAPGMDPAAVERLLETPRPTEPEVLEDEEWEAAPTGGGVAGAAGIPASAGSRSGSLASRIAGLAGNVVIWIVAIVWYGVWVVAGVFILGAIFLGWGEEPPPPPPKPAPQLRVLEQRIVHDGDSARYIALVHNDSRRLAAVSVFPFGEFRDRHGHGRGEPDARRRVELRPTIPPGGTGVVFDDLDRPLRKVVQPRLRFAARMASSRRSPFEVGTVRFDRRLCIITARLRSARPLDRSRVAVAGHRGGRLAGAGTFTVGPVPRGASTQVLYRLAPGDCAEGLPQLSGYPAPDPGQVLIGGDRPQSPDRPGPQASQ